MKTRTTIKEIAKELGVSVSTVSKALSNSPEIGEHTKTRIKEFATLKNYKPNSIAKNLKNQKSFTIGLIIPNILNPFFAKVYSGLEQAALKRGYNVIIGISNEKMEKEKQVLEMLNNGSIDGCIISVAEETQILKDYTHLKNVINSGTPIVMFDRIAENIKCDKVIVDDFEAAHHAINYLLQTGCKKILALSTIENLNVGKLRLEGYKKALKDNKITEENCFAIEESDLSTFDEKLIETIKKQHFDGIFAIDEHAATMALKMVLKNGKKVPEDVSIIGFADGAWSRRLTPSLSTISQHAPEIGETAANLLIDRLENPQEEIFVPITKIIKTELRKRDSVRKLN